MHALTDRPVPRPAFRGCVTLVDPERCFHVCLRLDTLVVGDWEGDGPCASYIVTCRGARRLRAAAYKGAAEEGVDFFHESPGRCYRIRDDCL